MSDMTHQNTLDYAYQMDQTDPLRELRSQFIIPKTSEGKDQIYFCGNSLGLQPKKTREHVDAILNQWGQLGVEAWWDAETPWLDYNDSINKSMSKVVGAKPSEVAIMNSLSVNLHLLLISFYRPTQERYKIIMEKDAFPSDQYIIQSQIKMHGLDPLSCIIEICPEPGHETISAKAIEDTISHHGSSTALILIGGVNYITGQAFDLKKITQLGHQYGCKVGFDLAHAAGNISLRLHDDEVDFAAWCNYKYLNCGPGSVGSIFVHERHHSQEDIVRLEGWWGNKRSNRFLMRDKFDPEPGAEAWAMSTPPIIALASIKASMEIFDQLSLSSVQQKASMLTGYLEYLLRSIPNDTIGIITPDLPSERGCQLSIRVTGSNKTLFQKIINQGVICDWREPDVIRVTPVPLYNSFSEVYNFAQILKQYV